MSKTSTYRHSACEALRDDPTLDTDAFVAYLRERHMASNVDLGKCKPSI